MARYNSRSMADAACFGALAATIRTSVTNRFMLVLITLFQLSACASGTPGRTELLVRDSAGIVIVENPAVLQDRVPSLAVSLQPIVSIGVVDGDHAYQFSRISGIATLSDGTIAALDQGSGELRYFTPDGRHIASAGGLGEGPGELSLPDGLHRLPGDTLAVWDLSHRRFTLFASSGTFAATVNPIHQSYTPVGFVSPRVVVGYQSTATARPGDTEGLRTNRHVFIRVDLGNDGPADTIAIAGDMLLYHWQEQRMMGPRQMTMLGFTPVPFTVGAASAARMNRLVVTSGTRPELSLYDANGRLERTIRILAPPTELSQSRYAAEVERRIASTDAASQQQARQRHAAMTMPAVVPAYTRIMLARSGDIWVELFRDSYGTTDVSEQSDWHVFDREGELVSMAQLPAGFTPFEIAGDRILGSYRDALGVEYVWVLAVQ